MRILEGITIVAAILAICAASFVGGYLGASQTTPKQIRPTPARMHKVCSHLAWDPKWGAVCLDETDEEVVQ